MHILHFLHVCGFRVHSSEKYSCSFKGCPELFSCSPAIQLWPQQDTSVHSLHVPSQLCDSHLCSLGCTVTSELLGELLVLPCSFVQRWWTSCYCLQWCLSLFETYRLLEWSECCNRHFLFWRILSHIHQFFNQCLTSTIFVIFLSCRVRSECLYLWKK